MDLLGRARGFFKGLSTPPVDRVQYYSVVCPEGHRVRGQRTEGYQAIRCPACGEGVFVLPSSTLPEPEPPPRSTARRTAVRRPVVDEQPLELTDPVEVTVDVADAEDRSADAEIIWDDEEKDAAQEATATAPPEAPRKPPSPTPDRKRPRPEVRPVDRPEAGTRRPERSSRPPAPREVKEAPAPAFSESQAVARRRTRPISRPVLIFGGLILLVVASFTTRTWRARRHQLPEVAAIGRIEGIPALEAGKFDKAYQLLAPARDAVDSLGGDVEGAEEIRHAADEAGILVDLLSDSLETLLEDAARTSPQDWASRFEDLYKGRSVIIDATVVSSPDSPGGGRYELDYLVLPPGEGAAGRFARLDVSDLQTFNLARPKVGDHVVFGARLAAFQYDSERESFVIRFDPKSGVPMRYTRALESLGWPTGSALPSENAEERTDEP